MDVGERQSIETFTGRVTHEVLRRLYEDLMHEKQDSLEDLLDVLDYTWNVSWNSNVFFSNKRYDQENYRKMAARYISDYYKRYYPFDQGRTIALEEYVTIDLDNRGDHRLIGYIDRLVYLGDGKYEIHDYKTNSYLPTQEQLDEDRQLALYAIGISNMYPDAENIQLVWHYLAHDKEMRSYRTDEDLEQLRNDSILLIDSIEREKDFPAKPSSSCKWCPYAPNCRKRSHLCKLESAPENEYANDPGVRLVETYNSLLDEKRYIIRDIDDRIAQVKGALVDFAKREGIDVVFGTTVKAEIAQSYEVIIPSWGDERRKVLSAILKEHNIWDKVSSLDQYALRKMIREGRLPNEVLDAIKEYIAIETTYSVTLSRIKKD